VLPSTMVAADEISRFLSKGHVYFPDEVLLGEALGKVYNTHKPFVSEIESKSIDKTLIRDVIEKSKPGFLVPEQVQKLLDACNIPRIKEFVIDRVGDALKVAKTLSYPVVMKVVGPIHKSDVGGVSLNIEDDDILFSEFKRLMDIPGAKGVLIQPMLSGVELFIGAKMEQPFGHIILCGIGGIFIELINDIASGIVPISKDEALNMIRSLKSFKIFKGVRGQEPIDEFVFSEIILKLSALLQIAPEITELDFNPLLAKNEQIIVVDARIRIG